MKRNLTAIILVLCLIGTSLAGAEGLLPSLVDTIGKPMPSLGEALGRYPDEEIPKADGGNTEVFRGVTETDFNMFSVYLSEKDATLVDYQAAGTSFSASIQVEGKAIHFNYDTQTLEARVTYPKGTYDEWLDYAKMQYESAVRLAESGKALESLNVFTAIRGNSGYKPAVEYLEAHPELAVAAREERIAPFRKVGGYVVFGMYRQTEAGNDNTPIEWLVLEYDAKSNRTLLLSRYGLDSQRYDTWYTDTAWKGCALRTWLNRTFLKKAFTEQEKAAILTTNVDNSKTQGGYALGYGFNDDNNTKDKIFLLSYAEAKKYLGVSSSSTKSRVAPTAYAQQAGAYTSSEYKTEDGMAAGRWLLRSPGFSDVAELVNEQGYLSYANVNVDWCCVRPALWINLESDIF